MNTDVVEQPYISNVRERHGEQCGTLEAISIKLTRRVIGTVFAMERDRTSAATGICRRFPPTCFTGADPMRESRARLYGGEPTDQGSPALQRSYMMPMTGVGMAGKR
jgi:hypothetical protein